MADTPLLSDTSDSDTTETNETTISIQNEGDNPGNASPTAPEVPAANGRIRDLIMDWIRNCNDLFAYVGNIVTPLCSLPNIWVAIALLLGSAIVALVWSYHARSRQRARDSLAPSTGPGPNARAPATGYMELFRDWIRNCDVPFSYLGNIVTLLFSPKELWRGITLLCGLAIIALIQTCRNSRTQSIGPAPATGPGPSTSQAPAQVEPPAHIQAQPQAQPPAHIQPQFQAPAQVQPPAHIQTQFQAPAQVQPPAHIQPQFQAPAQVQHQPRRALRRANTL